VLDSIDFDLESGEWLTVVGPNGAGKSTLVAGIAGVLSVEGSVRVDGVSISSMGPRDRAQLVALVPQQPVVPPGLKVADYVLLGRTPHLPLLGVESQEDLEVVADVLTRLDLAQLADRQLMTLSGGELQRSQLARAVAQETTVLLLDEPTTALDLGHQQEALELVDQLRVERGMTVISTMHDLTLAGQYSDRVMLLDEGRVTALGPAEEVMTAEALSALYGASIRVINDDGLVIVLPDRRGLMEKRVDGAFRRGSSDDG
jgi:iron complex transport system ATP-binding protein